MGTTKNNAVRAIVASATIKNSNASNPTKTSNGTEINGLVFNGTVSFSAGSIFETSVSNIRIDRCEFRGGIESGGYNANNYIIENCYITGSLARIGLSSSSSYSNFLFQNNSQTLSDQLMAVQVVQIGRTMSDQSRGRSDKTF